jgi:hypothetical protein
MSFRAASYEIWGWAYSMLGFVGFGTVVAAYSLFKITARRSHTR